MQNTEKYQETKKNKKSVKIPRNNPHTAYSACSKIQKWTVLVLNSMKLILQTLMVMIAPVVTVAATADM